MTAQHITVAGDILTPLNVALIIEVYEAACRVDEKLPDAHGASIAAKRLIAAFTEGLDDSLWLEAVPPMGSA
ncbi:MAG: hypothetical protein ABWY13_00310 [Mesorhizobium sp.]|jgi:hypothetical protein